MWLALAGCVVARAGGDTITVEFVGSFAPAVTQRVNSAGEIAGDFQFNSITSAMRYQPGVGRVALPVPVGATQSIGTGINEIGTIVGRYSVGSGTFGAIWSAANQLTTLPPPPGTWSYSTPANINNSGTVCGYATRAVVGSDPQRAWRWTAKLGYEMLAQPAGIVSVCRDINASGQVGGHTEIAASVFRACVWNTDGTLTDLGTPAGTAQSYGLAINDAGTVCGTAGANDVPFAWTAATGMRVLPDFGPGLKAAAYDINNAGWILGWADTAPFETVPVVWDPAGNLHNIATLVDPVRFYFPGDYLVPITISDTNLIVVRGYDFTVSGDPMVLMFRIIAPSACVTDLDGNASTGSTDLAVLLSAWGTAGAAGEDLDGDGVVGARDLAALLSAWGPCR